MIVSATSIGAGGIDDIRAWAEDGRDTVFHQELVFVSRYDATADDDDVPAS